MDNTSILSKSSNSPASVPQEICLSAKLRRLKIEENILAQGIYIIDKDLCLFDSNMYNEFSAFNKKNKKSFIDIKNMFQDIKTSVSSKDILKSIDIEDIKGTIFELESCIKTFKSSLETELAALKSAAHQINCNIIENSLNIDKIKKTTKIQTVKYNELVPSPVKLIMNSPFKCLEVQEFQDFMKNSPNRYGGWNEYNHNLFVNVWEKYFGHENSSHWGETERPIENITDFQEFLEEILPKLQATTTKDIITHTQWYSKYLFLKSRQQSAIEKWRLNRERMNKSSKMTKKHYDRIAQNNNELIRKEGNNVISSKLCKIEDILDFKIPVPSPVRPHSKFIRKRFSEDERQHKITTDNDVTPLSCLEESVDAANSRDLLNFLKPTKQWSNRCQTKEPLVYMKPNGVEYIQKVATPNWRIGL